MKKFRYMSPDMIIKIVVGLIILAVGIYAFFITIGEIPADTPSATTSIENNQTYYAVQNTSGLGNSVFNIIGIVIIIGAIMTIVGLVYSYVRPGAY